MRPARVAWAALVLSALAGCGPATGGPLVGPRAEPGSVTVCTPTADSDQVIFGEVLSNEGSGDARISTITGEVEGDDLVEYFIDKEGPERDENIGALGNPSDAFGGLVQKVLARAVPASGSTIRPGNKDALVIVVTPTSGTQSSSIQKIEITYEAEGRTYRENIYVEYQIAHGENC